MVLETKSLNTEGRRGTQGESIVTDDGFRKAALGLPEAVESAHMDHPDFRVGGKIFATLGHPAPGWGMVKLTPEQQHYFSKEEPEVFVPVKGGWGRKGATSVRLKTVRRKSLEKALRAAWRNTAPKKLAGLLVDND
jgi:hypothetical protein